MTFIITAQRLTDGVVVFLDAGGAWAEDLAQAVLHEDPEPALARARADVAANRVVDVRAIPAQRDGDRVIPARYRERLRAVGPSVRRDLQRTSPLEI